MLGSLTGMLNKLKENKMVQNIAGNITQNYSKLKDQVLSKYQIIDVIPQIYHIAFPQKEYISQLKAHIGQSEFQIWNVSEYQYDKAIENAILNVHEQGQINHLCFTMYSNLPFYQLILAIHNIHSFIQCNKNNKVYVHCQDNRVRSAILLSCYIYKYLVEDLGQAILQVNKALRVNLQDEGKKKTYKNLHILFKNFVNYHNNSNIIYQQKLKLLKFIINNPPFFKVNDKLLELSPHIRICIEIKCGEQTVIKQVYSQGIVEGNLICAIFTNKEVILGDQFLVIVKYLYEGKAYNMFRIQLNTNFIYQCFARIYQQDVDSSSFAYSQSKEPMHIDFIFQPRPQLSKLALLQPHSNHNHRQECAKEKQERKKEKEKSKALDEEDKTYSQAIASLNEQTASNPTSPTKSEDRQIEAKLAQLKITKVGVGQLQDNQQQEQQQDLQDYLSKLQSQV